MREVEVKGVVPDDAAAQARLVAAGATLVFEGMMYDRRYDRPDRTLAGRDEVLRVRVTRGDGAGGGAAVHFKGAAQVEDGYKVRHEIGTPVGDEEGLHAILSALGYVVTREIDRSVAVFAFAGAAVRFERYPRMDVLVEVEGDPAAIEQAIVALGIPRHELTAEPLAAFVRRYETRTGTRGAICRRELDGDYRYRLDDA